MRFLSIIIFIIINNTIISQSAITDFRNYGSVRINSIQTFDNKNYHIAIDIIDNIKVYEVLDPNSQTLLHERRFEGVYDTKHLIHNNFIIIEGHFEVIIYDFVNDIIKQYAIPDGYDIYRIRSDKVENDKRIIVTLTTGGSALENRSYIGLDIHTGFITEPKSVFAYYDDLEIDYLYQEQRVIVQDFKLDIRDTLDYEFFSNGMKFYEDNQVFLVKDTVVYQYNVSNGYKEIGSFRSYDEFEWDEENYVNGINHIYQINRCPNDSLEIQKMSKLDGSISSHRKIKADVWSHDLFLEYQEFLLIFEPYHIHAYNTETGESREYNSLLSNDRTPCFDSKGRLINYSWTLAFGAYHNHIELIDFEDGTIELLSGESDKLVHTYPENIQLIEFEEQYLINIDAESLIYGPFYTIDLSSSTLNLNYNLESGITGLSHWSEVVKVGGSPTLIADEIWYIDDKDEPKMVYNEARDEIRYKPYVLHDDILYFVQKNPNVIMSWNGEELNEEVDLSGMPMGEFGFNKLDQFAILSDCAYIMTWKGFYRYDKLTNQWEEVMNSNIEKYRSSLYSFNGYAYFVQDNGVARIDCEGAIEVIYSNEEFQTPLADLGLAFIPFQDKLLIPSYESTFVVSSDNSVDSIYDGPNSFISMLNNSGIDQSYYMMCPDQGSTLAIYNGESIEVLQIDQEVGLQEGRCHNGMYFFSAEDDYFVNANTLQVGLLPDEIAASAILSYFEVGDESFTLVRRNESPNFVLDVYQIDQDFSNINLIETINNIGFSWQSSYTPFGDLGMIYSGNKIVIVDNLWGLEPLENLVGHEASHNYITEKNGHVYFLANNAEKGLQWYTEELVSFRKEELDTMTSNKFVIKPNPATREITFDSGSLSPDLSKCIIYNQLGEIIEYKSIKNNSIDVSCLPSGYYILFLNDEKSSFKAEFIKVD